MEQATELRKKLSIREKMELGWPVDQAIQEAFRQAMLRHHKLGEDVVTWRDGKVVIVPAIELLKGLDDTPTTAVPTNS
ncbi:MAG: hypothetical protein HY820_37925 [Acidobacteria bacterium]|nr:hypothetical protein [Acidobacteriota bacterium]